MFRAMVNESAYGTCPVVGERMLRANAKDIRWSRLGVRQGGTQEGSVVRPVLPLQ